MHFVSVYGDTDAGSLLPATALP